MRNPKFMRLLAEQRGEDGKPLWNVGKLATAIYSNRSHVTEVLLNREGRGGNTRPKLVRFFKERFSNWKEMIEALGWDEKGRIVPRETTVATFSDSYALDNPKPQIESPSLQYRQ
jgi:hypothetical protein